MNIVEFIKFVLPELQILHAAHRYGIVSLRKYSISPEDRELPYHMEHAVLVPIPAKYQGFGKLLPDLILFLLIMTYPLYFITTIPFRQLERIHTVIQTGYAILDNGYTLINAILFIMLTGISLIMAPTRRMYYRLPWLLPYILLCTLNTLMLTTSYVIINLGYYVLEPDRAAYYFLLMSAQLVFSRLLICIWLYKKPMTHWGGAI